MFNFKCFEMFENIEQIVFTMSINMSIYKDGQGTTRATKGHDGTHGQRTDDDDWTDDKTDGRRTEDDDGTDDGTDGWTEDNDGGDGRDATRRTDGDGRRRRHGWTIYTVLKFQMRHWDQKYNLPVYRPSHHMSRHAQTFPPSYRNLQENSN